jgi:hypothetical protein
MISGLIAKTLADRGKTSIWSQFDEYDIKMGFEASSVRRKATVSNGLYASDVNPINLKDSEPAMPDPSLATLLGRRRAFQFRFRIFPITNTG